MSIITLVVLIKKLRRFFGGTVLIAIGMGSVVQKATSEHTVAFTSALT